MTSFEDGPAAGKVLGLKRSRQFLLVVKDKKGKFDALDQPNDMPDLSETIYAYRLVEVKVHCHVRGSKFSGFFPIASYRMAESQPSQETMRGIDSWRVWCYATEADEKAIADQVKAE